MTRWKVGALLILFFGVGVICLSLSGCNESKSQEVLRVPLQVRHDNMLQVELSVGGRDLMFLVDSAASSTAVDSRMLDSLDLPPQCKNATTVALVTGVNNNEIHFHNVSISIGGHAFEFQRFQSADFSSVMPNADDPLTSPVGVLGADFLMSTGAVVDFKQKELRLPIPLVSHIIKTYGKQALAATQPKGS